MKKLLLLSLLFFLSLKIFASPWSIGFETGYTLSLLDQRGGEREEIQNFPGSSFEIAVPVEYRPLSWLSITSAFRYIGKAYNTVVLYNQGLVFADLRNVDHFFEIPLGLRISLPYEDFRIYIGGGGYIGIRFLSSEMGMFDLITFIPRDDKNNFWNTVDLDPSYDNLFDAGIFGEIGVGYAFEKGEFSFSIFYQRSLTALDVSYPSQRTARYLDTFNIALRYSFYI